MPQATTSYSDLNIPTVNDDGNTYGVLINQFFEDLTGKIFTLAAQITSAQTDLGDTSTINTILYNINQLNAINTILTTSTASGGDGVTSDKLRTGTTVQLTPDPYGGSHTPTSSWPAYTGTGEALASISVPTTESEILNFDYQAFKTALDPIVSTISTRISQAQADIAAARIDICKAKKYTDAKQAGGTVTRSFTGNSFGFLYYKKIHVSSTVRRYESLSTSATSHTGGSFSGTAVPASHEQFMPMSAGNSLTLLLHSQHGSNIMSTYPNLGDTWQSCEVEVVESLMPVSAGLLTATILRYSENPLTFQVTLNYNPSLASGTQAGFLSSTNNATDGFFTINNNQNILVYTTPDVTSCDTAPGGPHYISGSYA